MRNWVAALAALLLVASGNAAMAACEGTTVLFEDRFDSFQPTWGTPTAIVKIENGQFVMAPAPATDHWVISEAGLYDDIDMCVALTTVTGVDPEQSRAGLVFWYVDANNFYVLEYAPNGKASVWRRQRGKWLEQVEWRDVEGARQGDRAVNELRVVTRGSTATFFVNETEFAELTGQPPAEGSQIGFFASSPEAGAARFSFDNLRVTRP